MTWSSALKRTFFLTSAGALVETTRRVIGRAIAKQRRARAMQRSKGILKKVGLAAAFTGLAFLIRGATMR